MAEKERRISSNSNLLRPPGWGDGMDLRTWLAGNILANPNIVRSSDPAVAVKEALKAADDMIEAMKAPNSSFPEPDSLLPPSDDELDRWAANLEKFSEKKIAFGKETTPALPHKKTTETIFPPSIGTLQEARETFSNATKVLRKASNASVHAVTGKPNGRYKAANVASDSVIPQKKQ